MAAEIEKPPSFGSHKPMKSLLRSRLAWLSVGLTSALLLSAPDLFAEEAAAAAAPAAQKTLWDLVVLGGWAMWPLGLFSVAMITLFVYNQMQMTRKKFVPPILKQSLLSHMSEVRVRSAIEEAAESPSYLGRLFATSLPHVDATEAETLGRSHVEDAAADFIVKENSSYMSWVGYFAIISQSAPMVGLLGTVSGMIKAFETLGVSGGSDPAKLANAISEALITTAAGLIVAIPCLFMFYYFKNTFAKLVSEAEDALAQSLDAAVATVNADQQLAKVPEGIVEG